MSQQISLDKNVTIEFTPQQLTIIFALLKKGSYEQVAEIVNTIEKQVISQLQTNEQ